MTKVTTFREEMVLLKLTWRQRMQLRILLAWKAFLDKFPILGKRRIAKRAKLFSGIAFPLVRRCYSSTIANDIIAVQPMPFPSALIFYDDFIHQEEIELADDDLEEITIDERKE